jgi:acyl-CoA reductase-like NAD-dependent aldehyde dehydrogenase
VTSAAKFRYEATRASYGQFLPSALRPAIDESGLMKMFLAGKWVDRNDKIEVLNPFDGSVVDTVPRATADDVDAALSSAVQGADEMRQLTAYRRYQILRRAADLMVERQEELGRIISQEEGKLLREGRLEALRAAETMEISAEEAKRLSGEVLPLDAASAGSGRLGFTLRVPCGVVVAITPFNFPLNLVCHKVGPALAAGNSVVLKPASDTPLSALALVKILLEAGLPPLGITCLTGSGATVGMGLVRDERVRKVSFTGSADVGREICQAAGLKRVTMELGSNSPLIVLEDADLTKVVEAAVASGYGNAGQVCISTQRVIAVNSVYSELIERLQDKVAAMKAGNQLDEANDVGPMVREEDAVRVKDWVDEAVTRGARLLCGGDREGSVVSPALLVDVKPEMKISCEELFGPAIGITSAESIEEAISLANATRYGLSAAVFTESLDSAIRFAKQVESGNIHINWGTAWRADLMPYGGLKESGMGKEGPKYAIQEMTEVKTVVIHGV